MRSISRLVAQPVLGRLERRELADVGARHERLAARAAQHEHAHVVVGVGRLAGLEQRLVHRERHRVVRLGAVEGDPQRRPAELGADAHSAAISSSREAGLAQHLGGVLARAAAPRGAPSPACRRASPGSRARAPCPPPGAPSRPPSRAPACAGRRTPRRSRGSGRRRCPASSSARDPRVGRRRAASVASSSADELRRGCAIRSSLDGEARVGEQLLAADHRAQPLPLPLRVARPP